MMTGKYETIDEYIALFPNSVQEKLIQIRTAIQKAAPKATEAIKYGIPTFVQNGNLVHFAAYQGHLGFYPGAEVIAKFGKEFSRYNTSKGTVQFPIDEPVPLKLITQIVKFRIGANDAKASAKKKTKTAP
jgi:uncharacterized protein YdhG (YjbR/CyaY superfamily)